MPFKGGARATELESSGALVERPLKRVLHLPAELSTSSSLYILLIQTNPTVSK